MIKDSKQYDILVIEDNPGDFILIEEYLHETFLAPSVTHVRDFISASAVLYTVNHFDVMLLDLSLPDVSGQELITAMLKLVPHCPIIILTGYTDINQSLKFISQGISDYLVKDDLTSTMLYKSIIYAIERRNIIEELTDSKKQYTDLFQLSTQPMWVYDTELLTITQVNQAALNSYGYTKEAFLNLSILDIRPKEDIPKFHEALKIGKANEGLANNGKFRHKRKSGEIVDVEVYTTPLVIDGRIYRSVIAIDITEKNLNEQKILKTIIETQENERYEVGGELHDNVGQILVSSLINMGMLKKFLDPAGLKWYEATKDSINLAIKEIRNLSHRIAPNFLDDTTLYEAVKRLLTSFNVDRKYAITLNFDEAARKYPIKTDVQLNLYRILQEQLKNVLKYANASTIDLNISIADNCLIVSFADNGIGFNKLTMNEGIGFANIKRRVGLLTGKFNVNSSIGNGCTIEITIPLLS